MDLGLREKVCVVTGSTVGIGLEVARQLPGGGSARRHVRSARRRDRRPARRRRPRASRASPSGSSLRRSSAFGRVDCLVNNVGGAEVRSLGELTDDDWQRSFELNLMSADPGDAGGAARRCGSTEGVIVNVSSTSGEAPVGHAARVLGDEGGRCSRSRASSPTSTRRTACAATRSRPARRRPRPGSASRTRRAAGRPRRGPREGRRRAPARPARRAGGDRSRDRLPLLGPSLVRHRRRLVGRRRHRPDHHLSRRAWSYAGLRCPSLPGELPTPSPSGSASSRNDALSPLAVRSYETRGRERAEDECSVRTPFQRDRDRILHSKPFRRLKGKTQVFIDPAGDHYRTRMTHTLETTGIARVVARALRLNEDLAEAIGLGHDTGHPPFGHAGEAALDARSRDGGFRHNEQSRAHRTAAQPDPRGRRRHPHAHRRARAGDARGQDRAHRRPRRLHQPRHRRRDPLRDPRGGRPAARRDRDARPDRREADRHARPRPRRELGAAGDIVQGDEVGAAMLSLRAFMFEHVYLGPETRPSTRAPTTAIATHLRRTSQARGDSQDEIVEFIAGMTDRFALSYAERRLMARIKDTSVEAVKAAADFVDVVSARTQLRKAGSALHGPLPVPRGADAVLLGQRRRQALLLLRLRGEGRPDHVRPRDGGPRLRRRDRVARRAVPRPARVRGELAGAGRRAQAARAALRAARPGGGVLRAHALGVRGRVVRARLPQGPRPGRGGLPRVPARARARRRHARPQGAREGLHARRAARRRPHAAARRRLLRAPAALPARRRARPRARLPGAQALRRRSAAARSTSTRPSPSSSTRARSSTGSTRRARRSRKEDRACVVEGNTDVIALRQAGLRAGRREHGHGAHRAAAEGARPAEQAAVARVRRRRRRRDGDAARDGARGRSRASTSRSSPLPPGIDPADDPTGFERAARRRRAVPALPRRRSRSSAPRTAKRRSARSRRCSTRCPTRPSGRTPGGTRTTSSA